ncbi:MAG: hypothetical protein U1F49_20175 [Rubrivivax sp.]
MQPRAVDVRGLQAALLRQGSICGQRAGCKPAATAAASSSQAAAANAAAGIRAPAAAD